MPLLELDRLEARYGAVSALHGLSLTVAEGEIVALLGANGAGKTTTLRAISGLVKKSGDVVYDGCRITRHSPERIARGGIAHVPEGRGAIGELTVRENLRLGGHLRRGRSVKRDLAQVYAYFPILEEKQHRPAGSLSGGQQQMLVLGRALMTQPRLLMLDEPSLGLAPLVVREIYAVLERLNREHGLTVLVVEQNASVAMRTATTAYVLETGRVALQGPTADLREDENVRRAYLGY
jgi:branched-chain amino acid transport system ATP-binding protein